MPSNHIKVSKGLSNHIKPRGQAEVHPPRPIGQIRPIRPSPPNAPRQSLTPVKKMPCWFHGISRQFTGNPTVSNRKTKKKRWSVGSTSNQSDPADPVRAL